MTKTDSIAILIIMVGPYVLTVAGVILCRLSADAWRRFRAKP